MSRLDLSATDPADEPALLRRAVERLRTRLDPTVGPLLQLTVLDRGARPAGLLVVVHELAADLRSLRVLLEDLGTACGQIAAGSPVALPAAASVDTALESEVVIGPVAATPGVELVPAPPVHLPGVRPTASAVADALVDAAGSVLGTPAAVDLTDHTGGARPERLVGCLDGGLADAEVTAVRVRYDHVGDPRDLVPTGGPFTLVEVEPALLVPVGRGHQVAVVGLVRDDVLELHWWCTPATAARLAEIVERVAARLGAPQVR